MRYRTLKNNKYAFLPGDTRYTLHGTCTSGFTQSVDFGIEPPARRAMPKFTAGFTFVETMIATAIFLMVSLAVYEAHSLVYKLISENREKTASISLAEELIEIVRNMPYADTGIIGGVPEGVIPRAQTFDRSGFTFIATTTVRNIDDSFDGEIGGSPNDLSPADYKLVEIDLGCSNCRDFKPFTVTTTAAPKSLETSSGNGALFVKVIDANGLPVADADISIEGQGASTISIDELSNNEGLLQIVDIPPGDFLYRITSSKGGFSSDRTYALLGLGGSTPVLPDSTVLAGQVTQITFGIDDLGSLDISTVTEACVPVPSVPVSIRGSKKIGTSPDVYKVDASYTSNGSGSISVPSIEWDSYDITLGSGYVLAGSIPLLPLALSPGADEDVTLVARTPSGRSLLLIIKDSATGLPLADAEVRVSGGGVDETIVTNKGFLRQTDWQDGGGQVYFGDNESFFSSDSGVEYSAMPGEMRLKQFFGEYVTLGELISSWFNVGSSTTLHKIEWEPLSQATSTGMNPVKFQIESANDIASTTTGFIGPDGTTSTFYTATSTDVSSLHTDHGFVRYKMYLSTEDVFATPIVSDIAITYGTECLPHGEAYFDGLSAMTYDVTVEKNGYEAHAGTVDMSASSEEVVEVLLNES